MYDGSSLAQDLRPATEADTPDYLTDPDFVQRADAESIPMELVFVRTWESEPHDIPHPDKFDRYVEMYRERGPWALPPTFYVVAEDGTLCPVTGTHREAAAYAAGLSWIPALVARRDKL